MSNVYSSVCQTATWLTKTAALATESHTRFVRLDEDDIDVAQLGRAEDGLYVVLHKTEVVQTRILLPALIKFGIPINRAEDVMKMLCEKSNGGVNNAWNGEVIVYGPNELLCDLSPSTFRQYLLSPNLFTDKIVRNKLSKICKHLRKLGLCVSIKTHNQLCLEQRSSACISWIHALANSADVLCEQVSSAFSVEGHLKPLLEQGEIGQEAKDGRLERSVSSSINLHNFALLPYTA